MKDTFKLYFWVIAIIAGISSLIYFDFMAYKYRFPDAPTWTYFFQNK
jgi:hypothetical protein